MAEFQSFGSLHLKQQEGGVYLLHMNGGENKVNIDFVTNFHKVLDSLERYL